MAKHKELEMGRQLISATNCLVGQNWRDKPDLGCYHTTARDETMVKHM